MSNEFLPLAGIRICDFSAVWAGQSATMYLRWSVLKKR